jgi:hypothetical protein
VQQHDSDSYLVVCDLPHGLTIPDTQRALAHDGASDAHGRVIFMPRGHTEVSGPMLDTVRAWLQRNSRLKCVRDGAVRLVPNRLVRI